MKPVVETVVKVEPKKTGRKERSLQEEEELAVSATHSLKVLVAAKYSGINVKVSFLFVIDSVRYNLTSCFNKVEKSVTDKFCLGDDKASSLTDSGAKSWNRSFTGQ